MEIDDLRKTIKTFFILFSGQPGLTTGLTSAHGA